MGPAWTTQQGRVLISENKDLTCSVLFSPQMAGDAHGLSQDQQAKPEEEAESGASHATGRQWVCQVLLPGRAGGQEEHLGSERASGPSLKLEVEEGIRSGLLPFDDSGLLSEPWAGPTTGTGRLAYVVGASPGVSSQEAGAEEQQHSTSLLLAVLPAAWNREHAGRGCLPHNIPHGPQLSSTLHIERSLKTSGWERAGQGGPGVSWPSEGLSGDLTSALGFDHKWEKHASLDFCAPAPLPCDQSGRGWGVSPVPVLPQRSLSSSFPPIHRDSGYQKHLHSMPCSTLLGPWCSKLLFLSLCEWICTWAC